MPRAAAIQEEICDNSSVDFGKRMMTKAGNMPGAAQKELMYVSTA